MSSLDRATKVARDRLSSDALVPLRKATAVISPTVTRRPALDAMLGDMAIIAKANLEAMRDRALTGHQLDEDEIQDFRHLCELVLKQSRLEMAVEKHVEQRTATMDTTEIREGIIVALKAVLVRFHLSQAVVEGITETVLMELGLQDD